MAISNDRHHINGFTFSAWVPPAIRDGDDQMITRIARGTYSQMLEVLSAAGFHHPEDLDLQLSTRGFALVFNDADLGFEFGMAANRIFLKKSGSRMNRFDTWYRSFMPSLGSLVEVVLDGIREFGEWNRVEVLRATLEFQIIAYDFKSESKTTGEQVKNSQVISRLIRAVPDSGGELGEPENVEIDSLGRVDYAVSRWLPLQDSLVRAIYRVEAPGNRDYSSLWFTYTVSGETYTCENDERMPFDFSVIVADSGEAIYEDMFLKHFVGKFMADLLGGFTFETTAGGLP